VATERLCPVLRSTSRPSAARAVSAFTWRCPAQRIGLPRKRRTEAASRYGNFPARASLDYHPELFGLTPARQRQRGSPCAGRSARARARPNRLAACNDRCGPAISKPHSPSNMSFGRHPDIVEHHLSVTLQRLVIAKYRQHTLDDDPRMGQRHHDHRLPPIAVGVVGVRLAHHDQHLAARIERSRRPPFPPLSNVFIALPADARLTRSAFVSVLDG